VVTPHIRFTAGVFVIAAGLLFGGGPVAVADPFGSGPHGDDGNSPSQGSLTSNSPIGNVTDTVREPVRDVTGTLGSGGQPGHQPSTGPTSTFGSGRQPGHQPSPAPTSPTTGAGATDTDDQAADAVRVPKAPNPVAAVPNPVAPVADAVAPVADAVAPVADAVAPVADAVAPVADAVAPVIDAVAPVADAVAPVADAVAPVIDAVAPVIDAVAPVADAVAPVPDVAGAVVPPTQLPSDLSSFLLSTAGVAPVVDGFGGIDGDGFGIAAAAPGASQVPLVLSLAGTPGAPAAGNAATGVASLDVMALGGLSLLSGMAPLAPHDVVPMGESSYFERAWEFLRASMWALAAVALPGVCGLVIITAVGVRVAYGPRTGFASRPAGISRFARRGPLGVVRSKLIRRSEGTARRRR
jgi:hypothetical protein